MALMVEREVKLRFQSPEEARAAILGAGATPLRSRRLQEDSLLDTEDEALRRQQCVLRIRTEPGKSLLTYKGPVQPGTMKGVKVLFLGAAADNERVRAAVEPAGVTYVFVEAK